MPNRTLSDRPVALVRAVGLCLLAVALLPSGCAAPAPDGDARRLLARSMAVMEELGLSLVPVESAADAMIVRRQAPAWRPFDRAGELARQAASVAWAAGAAGEAVLEVELEPAAAKRMFERRLAAELAAIRRESGGLLLQGAHGETAPDREAGGGPAMLSRKIESRLSAAERELSVLLAEADVRTVIRLRVDRHSAVPSRLDMETRIVRPAESKAPQGIAAREPANLDGGRAGGRLPRAAGDGQRPAVEETLVDRFLIR